MFERSVVFGAAVLFLLPGMSDAQWFQKARREAERNRCWPAPFLAPDRMAVRAPFAVMINNGWRAQNTLGDDHFDTDTGTLNEAGELKVRDILTYSPPEHRTVFVLQAQNEDVSAARNHSVSELVAKLQPYGQGPLVAGTNLRPRTAPADYISTIGTRFSATTPDPRLPASAGSSAGGGGGGGGGGSGGGGGGGY
jgi:uncharacterized membrane protein YgcG